MRQAISRTEFEGQWDAAYPPIAKSWRNETGRITPFFDDPPNTRQIIYTINAIESVNMSLQGDKKLWLIP
jgi:putative transposase